MEFPEQATSPNLGYFHGPPTSYEVDVRLFFLLWRNTPLTTVVKIRNENSYIMFFFLIPASWEYVGWS